MNFDVDALKKKFPVTHGRDFGHRVALGEIIRRVGEALDAKGASRESIHDVACDIIDRDLLFGAWGDRWEAKDFGLLRDIRGAIIAAYEAGRLNARETHYSSDR